MRVKKINLISLRNKILFRLILPHGKYLRERFKILFTFVQYLIPKFNKDGKIMIYSPQKLYLNKKNLPLNKYGSGHFCKFSVNCPKDSGVYLWVVDKKIIYIGETKNLYKRFNNGYGHISPRNCYEGGQYTNCKMNKIVLKYFSRGKTIKLYFHATKKYKILEQYLLNNFHTLFNEK